MKNKKIILTICAITLTITAGITTVSASELSKKLSTPPLEETSTFQDNDATYSITNEQIKHPEKIDGSTISDGSYFMTKEEYENRGPDTMQSSGFTDEELNEIIKEIESGKIKPFNPDDLTEGTTTWFTDSEGTKTIVE